jgi:hypothetical protein
LGEQKAPAIAEIGVVGAELVAVITQRQRCFEAVGERLEAAEMLQPDCVRQHVEANLDGGAIIAETQNGGGKIGWRNGIEKAVTEF